MFAATAIDAQIIADWHDFFRMTAAAAAGLTGLVFVALSMHQKSIRAHPLNRYRARSSLASMMLVFVLSGLVLVPRQTSAWLGLEVLVVIGADGAFLIWSFLRAREAAANQPQRLTLLRPYQLRTTLAVGVCLFGMMGAALVWAGSEVGFYILAAFSIVTI